MQLTIDREVLPVPYSHWDDTPTKPEKSNNANQTLGMRSLALFNLQSTPRVSVIIPTLNEAMNLPYVLPRIPAWVSEVLIVDGNSTDNTVQVARQLRPDVRIVFQKGKGKGEALRTGFAAATGEIIVMLDADGSTDPAEIPGYVGALLAGADFVKGSRFLQGGGTADMEMHRKFGNWAFVSLSRMFFGGKFSDLCYGYNAFWKRVLPVLNLDGDGFEIETMMNVRALKAGLKVAEVPSFEAERIHGTSNLRTYADGWRVLKTIFKERFAQPILQNATEFATAIPQFATLPINDYDMVRNTVQ